MFKFENPFTFITGKINGAIDVGNKDFKLNLRKPIYDPKQGGWLTDMKKDCIGGIEFKTIVGEISTRTNISNVINDVNDNKTECP